MYSNALYVSFALVYASSVTLFMPSGMERILSVADRISKEAKTINFMTDAGSSVIEKVQSKSELCACATEYAFSITVYAFSKVIRVASAPDDHASDDEHNDSGNGLIGLFTEQVSSVVFLKYLFREDYKILYETFITFVRGY